MNYEKILRQEAERSFENFINFIRDDKNLLYTINDQEDDFEDLDELEDETEVVVMIFDKDEGTDILGTYYFDNTGRFIREV